MKVIRSFKDFRNQSLEKPSKIQHELRKKYQDCIEKLFIYETDIGLELNLIRIKAEKRGQGCASRIINDLIDYANSVKKIIHLTPSKDFGSDLDRLTKFYKRFGFVNNQGRNRDFRFKDKMIKMPD